MGPRALVGCILAAATGAYACRHAPPLSSAPSPAWCATAEGGGGDAEAQGFFLPRPSLPTASAPTLFGQTASPTATEAALPVAVRVAAACCDFIDARCPGRAEGSLWGVESTDFTSAASVAALAASGRTALQLMRLANTFTPPREGATPAPVMRLIGFFPGVSTDEVYDALTDVRKRFAWDTYYLMFARSPGVSKESLALDCEALARPMARVAAKKPVCVGDTCTLQPDVLTRRVEDDWFCHKVGSSFLTRCGIATRFFAYERLGVAHEMRASVPPTSSGNRMYDILYGGSLAGLAAASPALQEWVRRQKYAVHTRGGDEQVVVSEAPPAEDVAHSQTVHVDMNYQHILLVPIADYRAQLLGQTGDTRAGKAPMSAAFETLAHSGSVRDVNATQSAYALLKESTTLAAGEGADRTRSGTLLLMTSANDAGIPSTLPMWLQRHISSVASHRAYAELMDALRKK